MADILRPIAVSKPPTNEKILLLSFIDDENPSSFLLITYDQNSKNTISRILTLKKDLDSETKIM
jgi:hypothetical protein